MGLDEGVGERAGNENIGVEAVNLVFWEGGFFGEYLCRYKYIIREGGGIIHT